MTTAGVGGSPFDAFGAAAASVVAAAAALAASFRCFGEAAPLKGGLRRERERDGKVKFASGFFYSLFRRLYSRLFIDALFLRM